MGKQYDFSGWATRYNVKCSDGRTIMPGAFKDCDGMTVPLMWNHQHTDPGDVMGHAVLRHADEGVKAYCFFNNTEAGNLGREMIRNGDISSLSIYANKLKQHASNVVHGAIREVSLVLAGANPEAFIDTVMVHSDDDSEEAVIFTGFGPFGFIEHSEDFDNDEDLDVDPVLAAGGPEDADEDLDDDEDEDEDDDEEYEADEDGDESIEHAEQEDDSMDDERTVAEVFEDIEDKLDPEEMDVVYAMIGHAANGDDDYDDDDYDDDEEDEDMKHNVFDEDYEQGNFLMHSDEVEIMKLAKDSGSFKDALEFYADQNDIIMHADTPTWGPVPVGGFDQTPGVPGGISALFPDYKDINPARPPEMVHDDWTWQEKVIAGTHKLPFSRVRTNYVDIRGIEELRAKGYPKKGAYKSYNGNFKLARRTTDPQTVYIKNALHRDDIIDITDFDYVQYLYKLDQQMLKNELANAILFGDGRDVDDPDKIFPDKIRPIWTDDDLYTIKAVLDLADAKTRLQGSDTSKHFSENYILAEAFIEKLLYTREKFKGTGTPDLFITPHMINVMLLSRDINGRRIYSSKEELKAALNVNSIITVEQMANKVRKTSDNKYMKLDALLVNLSDYAVGSTKGGEISHFTQFDIDFNQQKSLIETRLSGALTKLWSAIVIEEETTAQAAAGADVVTDEVGEL